MERLLCELSDFFIAETGVTASPHDFQSIVCLFFRHRSLFKFCSYIPQTHLPCICLELLYLLAFKHENHCSFAEFQSSMRHFRCRLQLIVGQLKLLFDVTLLHNPTWAEACILVQWCLHIYAELLRYPQLAQFACSKLAIAFQPSLSSVFLTGNPLISRYALHIYNPSGVSQFYPATLCQTLSQKLWEVW